MGHYTTPLKPGDKYNRLTVIERVPPPSPYYRYNGRWYRCKCDCGNEHIVTEYALKSGNTKSCGCLRREVSKKIARELLNRRANDDRKRP